MINDAFRGAGALLIVLALCRGSAYGFTKLALNGLSPGQIVILRLFFGAALLSIWTVVTLRRIDWIASDWRGGVIHALIGNLLPIALITSGQQSVPSGLAAVLMALTPLFTALLAHVLLPDEKLTGKALLGLAIGFSGVLTIVMARGGPQVDGSMLPGLLALTAAALCFALQTVFSRKWTPQSPIGTSALSLLVATVLALPFIEIGPDIMAASVQTISASVALGVVCTAIALLVMLKLAERTGASFVSSANYLIPVVGLAVGALFLNEPVYRTDLLAFVLILVGTRLVQSWPLSGGGRSGASAAERPLACSKD
ncbi:putative amino-acid metabolite efflux pump [compost metagenome]